MQYNDLSDADARFEMLMTWLKKTPKAVDKVSMMHEEQDKTDVL